MSATYNLKNQEEYKEFFDSVIESINDTNPVDGMGFPLNEYDEPITVDYLWKEFGHELDGTQSSLGCQVFNEVIEHFKKWIEPITEKRKKEIIKMAKLDYQDAWECGHINPEDDCDPHVLREAGLVTKEEQDVYTSTYCDLVG